jgi:hypothetical protein
VIQLLKDKNLSSHTGKLMFPHKAKDFTLGRYIPSSFHGDKETQTSPYSRVTKPPLVRLTIPQWGYVPTRSISMSNQSWMDLQSRVC